MAKCDRGREAVNGVGPEWRRPALGLDRDGTEGISDVWLPVFGSHLFLSHCVLSRPLVFRRIHRYLCYGFFLSFKCTYK